MTAQVPPNHLLAANQRSWNVFAANSHRSLSLLKIDIYRDITVKRGSDSEARTLCKGGPKRTPTVPHKRPDTSSAAVETANSKLVHIHVGNLPHEGSSAISRAVSCQQELLLNVRVVVCVCLDVRALKGKRLELSTPNLV